MSLIELIEILNKKMKRKNKFRRFNWRPGDQKIYISDISKIKKEQKWSPKININQGLNKVIEWIQKNENNIKKLLKP